MLRRLLMAALVVVSLASLAQEAQAAKHCCRGKISHYLFGDCGPGPFGNGYFPYAGYCPPANYTECGRRIW